MTTVVAYGMGVDSTAMLVGMQQRGERPDLILFADTGDEKPETYAYLPIINAWLDQVGFPRVTVVKNPRPKSNDKSLSESRKPSIWGCRSRFITHHAIRFKSTNV